MPELPLPDPPLCDSIVTLRPFTAGRRRVGHRGLSRPRRGARFTGVPHPYEPEHAREWIGRHADERTRGEAMHLAVTAVSDHAPLGAVGVMRIDWDHLRAGDRLLDCATGPRPRRCAGCGSAPGRARV
jgi:hypothetical protein